MNVRPGDLAISVQTKVPSNLGLIVQVLWQHVDCDDWNFHGEPAWWCRCAQPMRWHFALPNIYIEDFEGPVPDRCLRPISGPADGAPVSDKAPFEPADAPVEALV